MPPGGGFPPGGGGGPVGPGPDGGLPQPPLQGTVIVTVLGPLPVLHAWHSVTVTVYPSGIQLGPLLVQLGLAPVHVSVMVYVTSCMPPGAVSHTLGQTVVHVVVWVLHIGHVVAVVVSVTVPVADAVSVHGTVMSWYTVTSWPATRRALRPSSRREGRSIIFASDGNDLVFLQSESR